MDCSEEESTCETILINQDFINIANQLKLKYLKIKNDLCNEIINEILQENSDNNE
jgi:hypothetical protein